MVLPQRPAAFGSVILVLAIAITNHSAVAQTCNGSAPFSNGLLRIGANLGSASGSDPATEGGASLGVKLALGGQGAFATLSRSLVLYTTESRFVREGLAVATTDDAGATVTRITGGYSIPVATRREVKLCPTGGYSWQSGPYMWLDCEPTESGGSSCSGGVDGQARAFRLGGTIGGSARLSPTVAVVPFGGAAWVSSKLTAEGQGGSRGLTENYVEISMGAGLIWGRLMMRPIISFPVGLEGSGLRYGHEFAVSIGSRRSDE